MLKINQIVCPLDADMNQLKPYIAKKCHLQPEDILSYTLLRQSLDARKQRCYKLTVLIDTPLEKRLLKKKDPDITLAEPFVPYNYPVIETPVRPLVVGLGPAGMFAALALAKAGCRPIVLERGKSVDERIADVEAFWKTGQLNPVSNVQFGEGGAGTFSDGKLTTRIKDQRISFILQELVEAGADPKILYQQHPHIGTDKLRTIVKTIRQKIMQLGGEVLFEHQVTNFLIQSGKIEGVIANQKTFLSPHVILAIGHSATDTFRQLNQQGIAMEAKDFAVGVRIEHPQSWVNQVQYKQDAQNPHLPAAEYRLTHTTSTGRGVYTFCMCPGGTVVCAASALGQQVINGMSESERNKENANSAILVQVTQKDLTGGLFAGLDYIEQLEKKAWQMGNESFQACAQWAPDFLNSKHPPFALTSSYPFSLKFVDLHDLFDDFLCQALQEALSAFDRKMPGFARGLLIAVESRSSCPIRIVRDARQVSLSTQGLYPCGEGAGYAGGIVSSALDGLRCAEAVMRDLKT